MDSNESKWISMDPKGSKLIQTNSKRFQDIPIDYNELQSQ